MRGLRRAVDIGLPVLGIIIVLAGVLFVYELYAQLAVVVLGLLLIEAGVWQLANPLLPSERRYGALRSEVDDFIGLVRRLNTAALASRSDAGDAAAAAEFERLREQLHASVERMAAFAGDARADRSDQNPPG
jgi:hypothetical protein